MARQSKNDPANGEISLLKRELLALFFLSVGLFLYLSLFSYHPLDPSFLSVSTAHEVHNWGGTVGSYLADSLVSLFGLAAYGIGFFFLLASVFFFVGRTDRLTVVDVPLYFLFILFVAVFLDLTWGFMLYDGVKLEAGGFLGSMLAKAGVAYLGYAGAYLVLTFLTLLSFVAATRISLRDLSSWAAKWIKPVLFWIKGQCVIHAVRVKKSFDKWKDSRPKKAVPAKVVSEVRINRSLVPKPQPANVVAAEPVALKSLPKPEEAITALAPDEPRLEPRILERADKKNAKPVPPAQLELQNIGKGYQLPPINLLTSDSKNEETPVDEESLKMNARLLEKKLMDFNVEGAVTEIHPGPVITMYEFQPAPGVKLSRIANLADDLCLAMGGRSVRIVAPLPNKPAVGIEIPNNNRETVWLKDIVADERFQKNESKLVFAIGKDIEGIPFVGDLAKMPHLLVAGATGSGKSVSINTMILSILYKATPEEVRLIMVDPKMLELSIYGGIPHLLLPVVTEPKKAALALRWAVREMERRYKLLSDINARNIQNYNKKIEKGDFVSRAASEGIPPEGLEDPIQHGGKLPYIVIIIDELADLMMVSSRDVEESITRLAQMARAAGIHLILATQRPSVDVLTGVIKANFPARISFKVSSKHDARTVLDTIGSEKLLGNGDMLFIPPGASRILRVHGAFITETEVSRVVDFLKNQAKPVYDETILKPVETEGGGEGLPGEEGGEERDELYDQAVAIVADTKQASISMIQRKLRVGYNRAARMIERMETEGIVSPPSGAGHRQVLVSSFEPAN